MIYLTRNATLAGLAVTLSLTAGCVRTQPPVANSLNNTPLVIDGAMQKRDWDQQYVMYQNGTVKSPADRFLYHASGDSTTNTRGLVETPLFVANVIVLPFTFFNQPPGELVDSTTASTPSSFTAMPDLVAEQPSEAGRASNVSGFRSANGSGGSAVGGGGSGPAAAGAH